ncbi:MAG: metallophosphoesterase [Proteobacteria bacterium]|nr:metallophosphoesterase [Pseudomonadota bacterium]
MTRIAHITDLHFGAEDPAVVTALLRELNDDPPDLVAVSGDLTQRASIAEFRAAKAFLDALLAPWLAVPGNHDISTYNLIERFTDPYRRWRHEISSETAPVWRNDKVAVFGLNTARRMALHWDFSRGRVTERRLVRLLADLDAVPAQLTRVVVMHHPLIEPEGAPPLHSTGGAKRALKMFSAHRVALVLAGHLHRGYVRATSGGGEQPLVVQGATATSVRLRGEPNAYNRVCIGADGRTVITPRVWDGAAWRDREAPSAQSTRSA